MPSRANLATGDDVHRTGYRDSAAPYDGRVPSRHHRVRAVAREPAAERTVDSPWIAIEPSPETVKPQVCSNHVAAAGYDPDRSDAVLVLGTLGLMT